MGKIIATVLAVLVVVIGGAWLVFGMPSSQSSSMATTSMDAYGLPPATAQPAGTNNPAAGAADATQANTTQPATGATAPAATQPPATTNTNNVDLSKIMEATLHTNMGDITISFFPSQAPNTVANFIKLAQSGFYDGTKFHRVIKNFMDQGGDPLTKDDSMMARWGTGGPGYKFNDEVTASNSNVAGSIAMANSGPNTQGSQFFINAVDNHSLDSGYTVFGKVTSGMDVVTAINNVPTTAGDRPVTPVVLKSVTLK